MGIRNRVIALASNSFATVAPDFTASKLKNPFFFVGSGRSGTTMLAHLLASHRDIAVYPYEANKMWHPKSYPWHHSENCDTSPIWVDPYAFTQVSLNARTEHDDKRMKAVFGACQFILRGKCFVNKSALVTFMIPYILKLFPEARFIHIVRDGRAVALSFAIHDREMIEEFPDPYKKLGIDFPLEVLVEKFAESWKRHILEIEKQKDSLGLKNKGIIHELTYEDLCASPREQLALIASFMGLDPSRFSADDYSYVKNTNYKYQRELSPETIQKISEIMQPALKLKN
jgi:hypothetical protein